MCVHYIYTYVCMYVCRYSMSLYAIYKYLHTVHVHTYNTNMHVFCTYLWSVPTYIRISGEIRYTFRLLIYFLVFVFQQLNIFQRVIPLNHVLEEAGPMKVGVWWTSIMRNPLRVAVVKTSLNWLNRLNFVFC